MKSSDDVQIRSVASRANRGRCMVLTGLKSSPADPRSAYRILADNRSSNYRLIPRKEYRGNQRADLSDFRNCEQLTNERS
jgi:hypothetical protein